MDKPLSFAARDVLASATMTGTTLYLPSVQLPRPLYQEVHEALTRLGGTWRGGKIKGHVFDHDPQGDLKIVVQTGLMPPRNPLAFFPTPRAIVNQMLSDAALGLCQIDLTALPQPRLLEPSAGRGAIALAMRDYAQARNAHAVIHCCEIDPVFAAFLRSEGLPVVASDFLDYHPAEGYHAILMNPPFRVPGDRLAAITHVEHALDMLLPGGYLGAITPPGFTFRQDRRSRQFFALVEEHGLWEPLPDDAFVESGTHVKTVLLCMRKPCDVEQEEAAPLVAPPADRRAAASRTSAGDAKTRDLARAAGCRGSATLSLVSVVTPQESVSWGVVMSERKTRS